MIDKAISVKRGFFSSVIILAGGNAAAQLILLAASPVLTRLYSPEDFGVLAVFAALLSSIVVFSALSLEVAIPLPDKDSLAARLVVIALFGVTCTTLLCVLTVMIYRYLIASALGVPELAEYLWLLPFGIFFAGIYQVLNFWCVRKNYFWIITRTKLTQSLISVGVQILGAFAGPISLISGQVLGQTSGVISMLRKSFGEIKSSFSGTSRVDLAQVVKDYRKFPLVESWGRIFNTVSTQLPSVLLALLFTPAVAGIFMLASRVVLVPMQFIGGAIANVFYSNAPLAYREGRLGAQIIKLHFILSKLISLPVIVLIVFSPDFFAFVFGHSWRDAGVFVQAMGVMVYFQFIVSPLSQTYNIMNRQEVGAIVQLSMLLLRILAIFFGAYYENALLAIFLYSAASSICYFLLLIWIFKSNNCSRLLVLKSLLKDTFSSLAILFPCFLSYFFSSNIIVVLVGFLFSICLAAYYYLVFFKNHLKSNIL